MLARIYHNPQTKEENQSKLEQLLQLWGSNNIFDQDTINAIRNEMIGGPSSISFAGPPKVSPSADSASGMLLNIAVHICLPVRLFLWHYFHHVKASDTRYSPWGWS